MAAVPCTSLGLLSAAADRINRSGGIKCPFDWATTPPTSPRRPPTAPSTSTSGRHGSWAVFFSHPADFTPVCTTELGRTAELKDEFDKRGVKAIAISVDPVEDRTSSWAGDIGDVGGTDLNFPIIADPDRKRSPRLYDMIHPGEGDTSTVRSVFIIDPNNKVRLTLTYPKSVGRNFDEILRVIDALQLTDLAPVSTPGRLDAGRARDRVAHDLDRGRQGAVRRRRGGQAVPALDPTAVRLTERALRVRRHGARSRGLVASGLAARSSQRMARIVSEHDAGV